MKMGRSGKGAGFKTSTENSGRADPHANAKKGTGAKHGSIPPCKHLSISHQDYYAIHQKTNMQRRTSHMFNVTALK